MQYTKAKENGRVAVGYTQAQAQAQAGAHAQHTNAHATGYAQDLVQVGEYIAHIVNSEGALANVTNPNWLFVAIGFKGEDLTFPVLARNKETGEWVYSRALIWCEATESHPAGFVWINGHYLNEKDARESFREHDGIVYYTEAY